MFMYDVILITWRTKTVGLAITNKQQYGWGRFMEKSSWASLQYKHNVQVFLFHQNTPMFSHPYYAQTDPNPNPAALQRIAEPVCVLSVTLCNLVVSAVA